LPLQETYNATANLFNVLQLALPDNHGFPACFLQPVKRYLVPFDIILQLWQPKFQPAFRHSVLPASVLVPKATMHEYDLPALPKDQIRVTWQVF